MTHPGNHGEGSRPNGSGPSPVDGRREQLLRIDRIYGITLFVIGIFATVNMMLASTERVLVMTIADFYEQYGLGGYVRPEGLAAIEWAGIILHPLNYAIWLYFAVRRWRAKKFSAWFALMGALVAWTISTVLMASAIFSHPGLIDAMLQQGFPPAATPAP
ncbi:DUF6264 family protein [uncultured Gulosibacter sp.]|uniref:DUF6264 family protein n=1 Tax=uncultured Gulosibacter sp. TaxID=1339167 RepID=UPI0028893F0A|nr:DUF6264 family protein [uncultured Gulosibacter sp.]